MIGVRSDERGEPAVREDRLDLLDQVDEVLDGPVLVHVDEPDQPADAVDCASCHQDHHEPAMDCASCHMPKVRPHEHLAFTNHWIGVFDPADALVPRR